MTSSTGSWTTFGSPWPGLRTTARPKRRGLAGVVQTEAAGVVQTEAEGPAPPDWWLIAVPDRDYYEQVETEDGIGFLWYPFPGGSDSETRSGDDRQAKLKAGHAPRHRPLRPSHRHRHLPPSRRA